jgi:hypothetical protein
MKRQVNDMERLTEYDYEQVMLKGLNVVGIGEQNADILEAGVRKLAAYEDTGRIPEEIINIEKMCREQSNNMIKHGIEMERLYEECERWKKEAITYANQLGMLRIWHSKYGPSVGEILEEDYKTTFPDTKYSE